MALGTTGTVIAAGLVAGAVGAGTAVLLREPPAARPSPSGEGLAALEERVDRQEEEIAALRARLEEATQALRPGRPGGPGPGGGPGAGFRPGVDGPPAPGGPPGPGLGGDPAASPTAEEMAAMSPEERARVESVVRELREKEQEENRRARLVAQEAGLRARIDRLPEQLALTPELKEAAVRTLLDRGEKLRLAMEEARAAGGAGAGPEAFRAAREKSDAIRRQYHDILLQSLTAEQARAVESVADRAGPSRGGGGGLGDGGGGGRRNGGGRNGGGAPGPGQGTPPR